MHLSLDPNLKKIVSLAMAEDATGSDLTTQALIPKNGRLGAIILAKDHGVLCGIELAEIIFKKADPHCKISLLKADGDQLHKGERILKVEGRARAILTAERTVLNFMQRLCGIASLTHKFVQKVQDTSAIILDTRKTVPGLRALSKYAVRCGGGKNHRMNLSDMVMIKDNHWKLMQDPYHSLVRLKKQIGRKTKMAIEVESQRHLEIALECGADIIMLDNMRPSKIKNYIAFIRTWTKKNHKKQPPLIEVTGGVTLRNIKRIADCGADRISVGALTHSAPALDLSLEIDRNVSSPQ